MTAHLNCCGAVQILILPRRFLAPKLSHSLSESDPIFLESQKGLCQVCHNIIVKRQRVLELYEVVLQICLMDQSLVFLIFLSQLVEHLSPLNSSPIDSLSPSL